MRAKQILQHLPTRSHFRLILTRLSSSTLLLTFTAVTLLHFTLQISFQAYAFSINARASSFLSSILTAGGLTPHDNFAVLVPVSGQDANGNLMGGELRICNQQEMEVHENIYECPVVWKGKLDPAFSSGGYSAPTPSTSLVEDQITSSAVPDVSSVGLAITSSPVIRTSTSVRPTSTSTATNGHDNSDDGSNDSDSDDVIPSSGVASGAIVGGGVQGVSRIPRRAVEEKRDHDLVQLSALKPWKRGNSSVSAQVNVAVEGVASNAVFIPSFKNVTSGEMGVTLSNECVQMIVWPNQIIHNTKREDVTFLSFQIWVLGMSLVALLNESIPHILAALATHVLATAWSGYQLVNTKNFQSEFIRSTISSGRCGGVNLLPGYWQERRGAEIAVLVVNCVSLVVGAGLSWRLVKTFGWQTFKRIGASLLINRVYKIVLVFSIGLQLAGFFIVAATGLWLDAMFNTILGSNAENVGLYKTTGILTCIGTLPWLLLGWHSVRREAEKLVSLFLALSLLMLAGWGSLFFSSTFRWEFLEWKFFGAMTIASCVLLVATTILGIVAWYNFGKGLKKFLTSIEDEEFEREKDQFTRVYSRDIEKTSPSEDDAEIIDFPVAGPLPTYAVAFGGTQTYPAPDYGNGLDRAPTYASSLGSSLHSGPVMAMSDSDIPRSEYSREETIPPRFRSQFSTSVASSSTGSTNEFNSPSKNFKMLAVTVPGKAMNRADSASSNESGSNPFSLDPTERRSSVGSGFSDRSGRSGGQAKKTYATAGSHFAPPGVQLRNGSQASWEGKKNWVIE